SVASGGGRRLLERAGRDEAVDLGVVETEHLATDLAGVLTEERRLLDARRFHPGADERRTFEQERSGALLVDRHEEAALDELRVVELLEHRQHRRGRDAARLRALLHLVGRERR